jgi:hypothetical protein
VFSAGVALNTSLNVGTAVDIGNSFGSVNLAAFARSVSLGCETGRVGAGFDLKRPTR